MMAKISVIVPIYNVEQYVIRTLDSLVNQSLRDLEFIVVDDGSTDNSYEICKAYAEKDDRIKLLRKKNEGVSSARNYGLKFVESEYVAFMDSDDYIDNKMLETLYSYVLKYKLDTIFCSFYYQKSSGTFIRKQETMKYECFDTSNSIVDFLMNMVGSKPENKHTSKYFMTVWRGLYSTNIIKTNNICFRNFKYSEDLVFNFDYLINAKKVGIIPDCLYFYCWNGKSLSNSYNNNRFKIDFTVYEYLLSNVEKLNLLDYKVYLDKFILLRVRLDIMENIGPSISCKDSLNKIHEILSSKKLREAIKDYPYKKLPFHHRLFFLLLKMKSTMLIFLVCKIYKSLKY